MRIGWRFGALFIALTSTIGVVVGAASVVTGGNFFGGIKAHLPDYLTSTGIFAFILAAAKVIIDSGRVEVNQGAPSDAEEFSNSFQSLIKTARTPAGKGPSRLRYLRRTGNATESFDRLVFFIDELDRCDRKEVVETLVAIRTFLDEPHCIFVVAADRAVLQEALDKEAPQETPINEEAPYYSTAGAFLDKVFQHQISLPPLRGRRLTKFARDLVLDRRSGVWAELRDTGRLDQVVYTLIPAHIRSPRRVKVLMNNFAVNSRIASSRGVEWPARAEELAKLTALETEFPQFAQDLVSEPRLPRLLLHPDTATSDRARDLVSRHSLAEGSDEDTYLSDDSAEESQTTRRMQRTHREQLRRYLERTAGTPDLRRDLFYLELAGAAFGLDDPELGDRIEDDAPDRPADAVALIRGRTLDEQVGAIRLLADMVQGLVGPERVNVVTTLLDVIPAPGQVASREAVFEAANALRTFLTEAGLADHQLIGALRLALDAGDDSLRDQLLGDQRLLADNERLRDASELMPLLPKALRSQIVDRIAAELPEEEFVLLAPLGQLPEPLCLALLDDDGIREAIKGQLEASRAETQPDGRSRQIYLDKSALASNLVGAAIQHEGDARVQQMSITLDILLAASNRSVYRGVSERAVELPRVLGSAGRSNYYILRLWQVAPEDDWKRWSDLFDDRKSATPDVIGEASRFVAKLMGDAIDLDPEGLAQAIGLIARLVQHVEDQWDEQSRQRIYDALTAALDDAWWDGVEDANRRAALHALARELIPSPLGEQVSDALARDVSRAAVAIGLDSDIASVVIEMIESIGPPAAARVVDALPTVDFDARPAESAIQLEFRTCLADRLRARGWRDDAIVADADLMRRALMTGDPHADRAVSVWLRLEPAVKDVNALVRAALDRSPAPTGFGEGLATWASAVARRDRTRLVEVLIRHRRDTSDWIAGVAEHGLNETGVIALITSRMQDGRNEVERSKLARKARAVGPRGPTGQRKLAELILWLLGDDRPKADIDVAVTVVEGLGREHDAKRKLSRAFERAAERHRKRLSRDQGEALLAADIDPPTEAFGRRVQKLLFPFLFLGDD